MLVTLGSERVNASQKGKQKGKERNETCGDETQSQQRDDSFDPV